MISRKSLVVAYVLAAMTCFFASTTSAQSPVGVNIDNARSGSCTTSRRQRVVCFFPSELSAYTNAQAIRYTGGSGADVYWRAVRVNGEYRVISTLSGTVQGTIGDATASTSFERSGDAYDVVVRRCVIGQEQYQQNPYCQNPLRYVPVTVAVHPHNKNWHTSFEIIPD